MRLTEKNNTGYLISQKYFPSKEFENKSELESAALLLNKLGQLEDIEEELGIDLITLFKALKNGIYEKIKPNKKNRNPEPRFWSYEDLSLGYQFYSNEYEAVANDWTIYEGHNFGLIICGELFNFEDYGRTWALTKEELL